MISDGDALRDRISVIVVECAFFRSGEQSALISFDVFVRNGSNEDAYLLLTHIGTPTLVLFASGDHIIGSDNEVLDERVHLLRQVYDNSWSSRPDESIVEFGDPVEASLDANRRGITARLLTVSGKHGSRSVDSEKCLKSPVADFSFVSPRGESSAAYEMRDLLGDAVESATGKTPDWRPFGSYRVGPFPATKHLQEAGESEPEWTVFRVTIELCDEAYRRLVAPQMSAPFEMTSSERVVEQLRRRLCHNQPVDVTTPEWNVYREFFNKYIDSAHVRPQCYQIVLGQPDLNDERRKPESIRNCIVQVRPTSSNIAERYIKNEDSRCRAMWFHSWGPDFSLVLRYQTDWSQDVSFRCPLPSNVECVPK
ncbi:MAG: hypothetical protein AABP62_00670 [Planctomycetota bacterium]